jgi:hypothetical protein
MQTGIKNIVLTIAGIKAAKIKKTGAEIVVEDLLNSVLSEVRGSAGDFTDIFKDITMEDTGGVEVDMIRFALETDYRRAATKIYKAESKRRRRRSK